MEKADRIDQYSIISVAIGILLIFMIVKNITMTDEEIVEKKNYCEANGMVLRIERSMGGFRTTSCELSNIEKGLFNE